MKLIFFILFIWAGGIPNCANEYGRKRCKNGFRTLAREAQVLWSG